MGTGRSLSNFKPATPLCLPAWQQAQANHHDSSFVDYILNGIRTGFHVGAVRSLMFCPSPEQYALSPAAAPAHGGTDQCRKGGRPSVGPPTRPPGQSDSDQPHWADTQAASTRQAEITVFALIMRLSNLRQK